jgi:hypothetical protein
MFIKARGHPNILATHKSTIEITTEDFLTKRGDCIIVVSADRALCGLDDRVKEGLRNGRSVKLTISCDGFSDTIKGYGNPRLTFKSDRSMVIRKSDFVCGRTLCVRADKAASDLDRGLVEKLKAEKEVLISIELI